MGIFVPSPTAATPRWPNLVAAVGGEAAIRQFTQTNGGDGTGSRWERGITFTPPSCDMGSELPQISTPCATDVLGVASNSPDVPADVSASALYYWTVSQCSTFGSTPDEIAARAREKLQISTSHKLEAEFWTGAAHRAATPDADGQWLTDANVTQLNSGTATPLCYALARLQQGLASCGKGRRGMIHCTPYTAALWFATDAIVRDGSLLMDAFGNIVVAGTGYDGSSPANVVDATLDTAWAYATLAVNVRLSEIFVVDANPSRLDRDNNVDTSISLRAGLVSMDSCCQLGVNVDHNTICGT